MVVHSSIAGRFNTDLTKNGQEVVPIQTGLIDPDDIILISTEALIVVGLFLAVVLAYLVQKRHAKIATGWNLILLGLFFLFLHATFDMLDTLQIDDLIVDILQVLDGSTFVIGLIMFAIGIYRIADFGAKKWGL